MAQPWDYIAKLVCIGDSGTGKSSLTIRLCEGRFVPQHDVTIGVEFGSRIVNVGPPSSLSSSTPHTPPTSHSTNPSPQKRMKLSLWDTAGQETYKSITRSYFRGASGALLVFDITRRSTFDAVTGWLHDLRQIAEEGIVVVLVGNKSDLCPDDDDTTSHLISNANPNANGHAPSSTPTPLSPNAGPETAGLEKRNKRAVSPSEAQAWCTANNVLRYVETSAKSGAGVEAAFLEVAERIYQNIEGGKYDLNDRRSGVKGAGAGGAGVGNRGGGGGGGVRLGMNDTRSGGGGGGSGKGSMGGCC